MIHFSYFCVHTFLALQQRNCRTVNWKDGNKSSWWAFNWYLNKINNPSKGFFVHFCGAFSTEKTEVLLTAFVLPSFALLKRVLIECRNIRTKVIAKTNQRKGKYYIEPMKIQSEEDGSRFVDQSNGEVKQIQNHLGLLTTLNLTLLY